MDAGTKLREFMAGFAAASELLARAQREGFFIECVCLTASTIDGLLRMGLILKHQLDTSSTDLLDQLLHQADEDAVISEREVYRRSLQAGIVDQATFDELERLYKERNRVVHRYIISEITTQEVLDTAIRLDEIMRQVTDQVSILEEEQLRLGVGMTRSAKDAVSIVLSDLTIGKHGNDGLARALREPKRTTTGD